MYGYEVISYGYITADKNYFVKVIPCNMPATDEIREIRLPYRPRVGQIIKLKR